MTALAWLLAALVAVQTGLVRVLVGVVAVLADVAAFSPEATGVVLAVVLATWLAYRADWPDGYRGAFAGMWR